MIGYGDFITHLVNFVIVAWIIFIMVKIANRVIPRNDPAAPKPPSEVQLLTEIRDELKKRG
jgi:large conductance mechanosensitive channel